MNDPSTSYWAPQRYFFDEGLRFGCLQCGHCCTGGPGIVYVSPTELPPLARHLGLSEYATIRRYLSPWHEGHTVREGAHGRCLFYDKGCTIYPLRPAQCATWPFWIKNLRSRARWEAVAKRCPGIGRGKRYGREEILSRMWAP